MATAQTKNAEAIENTEEEGGNLIKRLTALKHCIHFGALYRISQWLLRSCFNFRLFVFFVFSLLSWWCCLNVANISEKNEIRNCTPLLCVIFWDKIACSMMVQTHNNNKNRKCCSQLVKTSTMAQIIQDVVGYCTQFVVYCRMNSYWFQ